MTVWHNFEYFLFKVFDMAFSGRIVLREWFWTNQKKFPSAVLSRCLRFDMAGACRVIKFSIQTADLTTTQNNGLFVTTINQRLSPSVLFIEIEVPLGDHTWVYLSCSIMAGLAQSVWCLTTGLTTGRSEFDPRQRQRIFPLSSVSRPALRPAQPPVRWVPGVPSPGLERGRGVTLTTHPHLVPRSWMSRSCTSSPPKRLHGV
jgi:hypothetical protein